MTSDSLMAPDAGVDDAQAHLGLLDLLERVHQRPDRALHVALDDDVELLAGRPRGCARRGRRATPGGGWRAPRPAGAGCARRRSGGPRARSRPPGSARRRRPRRPARAPRPARTARPPRGRRRCSRPCARTRPNTSPATITSPTVQRAALHQQGRDRAAARVEARLDHGARGLGLGVGLAARRRRRRRAGRSRAGCRCRCPRRAETFTNSCVPPQSEGMTLALGELLLAPGRGWRRPCRSC